MSGYELTAYAAILVSLTIAPGPLIAILVARTLARDIGGAVGFGIGIAVGDVFIIVLVCTGMGLWLQSIPMFFMFTRLAALVYLLWLAVQMWVNSTNTGGAQKYRNTSILSSVAAGTVTCVLSPQTILLYLVLLPRVVDIDNVGGMQVGILSAFTFFVLSLTFFTVISLAVWLKRFLKTGGKSHYLNKVLAVVIAVSGGWLVLA